ncbi:5-methylcytosine-specific restriction enzyme B [Burkholderia cenocepacia]|uniref:AAA family ATPase n=1 Tax=Burkholderia cenocepacia TaxID=95486 RepID=UPI0019966F95|nr:AAA family ATPase [Burkholderia cenocepacia]MBR8436206.1 AAA family ATPase [Burkholderia cenocepacia]CAB5114051.1 5-methylcytosine-specific restriction enzyme B [Burkholderia cenocepacia]CAB5119464.1 5-methylcytosine-specific restriction enzyme B [Burkholderia cenocepacia]CAB5141814.1 5-methylcytosine-specific restriction enzyme B [Burkholderia cenocepacia]CAB5143745.1 5-methylcytosine-specific restriction enzyme B [Burkholderia cenocepacia]
MTSEQFVTADAIKLALIALRGTADSMLKVWFTIKKMGFTRDRSVLIDTSNPTEAVERLFSYGASDTAKEYFVPFATTRSDLTMGKDAPRTVIQTNIKKFHDSTVGFDPRSFLRIERDVSGSWKVSAQPGYPQGLGLNKDGFAKGDTQRVALPLRAWATWYGRRTPVPIEEVDPVDYLVRLMISDLNIDAEERAVIFVDDVEFKPHFEGEMIESEKLRGLVEEAFSGAADSREDRVFHLDERTYQRRLAAIRTRSIGPRWISGEPLDQLKTALEMSKAVLLYGPPRTGKTRAVMNLFKNLSPTVIQIHDGWGYENLVVGLKSDGKGGFGWREGPLTEAIRAKAGVIVLEEANRTQLSQALGEVFSLLEDAYRGDQFKIELRSGDFISIDRETVFVFTMNTLDNSTEEVDDALLGRVASVEFPPRVEDLRDMLFEKEIPERDVDSIVEFFAGVQEKYPLGHGYFARLKRGDDYRAYYLAFIRPVLQKHFRHRGAELTELDLLAEELLSKGE